ncbi:hypothetical protein E2C01_045650 [Portunus trituberculatus]|uniref:Uncharacterized protein n=1 Tax=Portunus trituberculatus TaxID=210409 RepID=A0A5B7G1Y4_PORTR|nr:hypothetical protein [Portunus trituberculatus]
MKPDSPITARPDSPLTNRHSLRGHVTYFTEPERRPDDFERRSVLGRTVSLKDKENLTILISGATENEM